MIKPVYELLLWDNCHNGCAFCHLKNSPRFSLLEQQRALDCAIQLLNSDTYVKGSHVLLVGGELFDEPRIKEPLTNFLYEIVELMSDGSIDLLYVNTNLLYKDVRVLYKFLTLIAQRKLESRLRFTTSFDPYGRFKTERHFQLFKYNLFDIRGQFPSIKIVANIILTNYVCQDIIDGRVSLPRLESAMGVTLVPIPYIVSDSNLTPTREEVFKALSIYREQIGGLDKWIANLDLEQQKLLYKFDGRKFNYCSSDVAPCGHSENFKRWSSKGTCFICDVKELFDA